MTLAVIVLTLVTLQRIGELVIAQRNTAALLAKGAYEVAPGHYPLIVAVHAAWLASVWWLAALPGLEPSLGWLMVFALLQCGRLWVLATLGGRWTTRIIVLPGTPLVTGGPFRYLDHPNYAVVCAEIAVLPVAFGLYGIATAFTVLNALVLIIRMRAETAALKTASTEPSHGARA